jgi:SAM-dependent methyltransferase
VVSRRLKLVHTRCGACDSSEADFIGCGPDYEYQTSSDTFSAFRCRACGNIYINPRPDECEFATIYPDSYHSLDYRGKSNSLVSRVRAKLETRRLLRYCAEAPAQARILDIGCGDGFHLNLLRQFGPASWTLEGLDVDPRAARFAQESGLNIHLGEIEKIRLPADSYDAVYSIQTIEHVSSPYAILSEVRRILKPGGTMVVVTDNTDSIDARLFRRSYWGGYHFPRHWNLFNRAALSRLAERAGLEVVRVDTLVSPVNWVYSIRNLLDDRSAPKWLVNRFTLNSPVSLAAFTMMDMVLHNLGRGALLNAYLRKPKTPVSSLR